MYSKKQLSISGFGNQQVPHEFLQQDKECNHLAIILPGYGYSTDMPLMYYPAQLLLNNQTDVLKVQYAYSSMKDYGSASPETRRKRLFEDVTAACEAGLAQRTYAKLTLIGKSLGTLAMGNLLTQQGELPETRCVWLTPLLRIESLFAQVTQVKRPGLFVIGTADSHYDASLLAQAEEATGGQSLVIEGANHSMEIPEDLAQTLGALQKIMQAVEQFLSNS